MAAMRAFARAEKVPVTTGVLVAHTGALLEMAHLYGDVKTTAKTTVTGVTWTSTLIAKLAVIGGAVAAAWHWLWPKG